MSLTALIKAATRICCLYNGTDVSGITDKTVIPPGGVGLPDVILYEEIWSWFVRRASFCVR